MTEKLVSVITPLYNSGKYIKDAIESVIQQSYKNWEMIIIDDASTDDGVEIAGQYASSDPRIKLIRLQYNQGGAVARNKGIECAAGEYIAFLDSDDWWYSDKLEKQINFMEKTDSHFTFTEYELADENGQCLGRKKIVPEIVTYKQALFANPVGCLTAVYNQAKLGKIYMPLIRKRQDYGLWLAVLKKCGTGFGIHEVTGCYRIRKGSVSRGKMKLVMYQWELYRNVEKIGFIASILYVVSSVVTKILRWNEREI